MKAFRSMLKVELKLSIRDMNMLIFAIAMPLIVTAVIGFIYKDKPAFEGANYTAFQQSFGAMAAFGILASGVMGLPLVLSEYREKKILKRYRCTPMSSSFLYIVQVVKFAIYSISSMILVLLLSFFFGYEMQGNLFAFIGAYLLVLVSIYSIGMLVAAVARNAQSAGLICSIIYFPMLVLSGTTIPYEIMPKWLQIISDILPLTQGISLLKTVTLGLSLKETILPIIVLSIITVICSFLSTKFFKWEQ